MTASLTGTGLVTPRILVLTATSRMACAANVSMRPGCGFALTPAVTKYTPIAMPSRSAPATSNRTVDVNDLLITTNNYQLPTTNYQPAPEPRTLEPRTLPPRRHHR